MMEKNYAGLDGFVWWMGVVENRNDPLNIGRCQVRIYGFHTESLSDIPTEDLPWAHPVHSLNNRSFATPKEADVVFGFFADGRSGQYPIMMGIIPGIENNIKETGSGYHDLRSQERIKYSPRKPESVEYTTDGNGVIINDPDVGSAEGLEALRYPLDEDLQKPTTPRTARYNDLENTVLTRRKENLAKNIETADGLSWSEPYPAYNALYPFNHSTETESGHIFELDDTPKNERIAISHRSGTYTEIYPSGSKVEKITRSNYQIVMADDNIYIMGRAAITIDSDCLVKIKGDVKIEAGNDVSLKVAGTLNMSVREDLNIRARSLNIDVDDRVDVLSGTDQYFTAGGSTNILAAAVVNIDGVTTSIQNGDSEAGTSADIPLAGTRDTKNDSSPTLEEPPVPISLESEDLNLENVAAAGAAGAAASLTDKLDAITGDAYEKSSYKDTTQQGDKVEPMSNTAPQACNFNSNTATFIDKSSWSIGSAGLNIIKESEGFRADAYVDPATGGEPITIGYGSTAAAIDRPVKLGDTVTKEQAEEYLAYSVNKKFMPDLKRYVKVPLTQGMIDACLSFIYNVGGGNFGSSTLVKKLNAKDYCGAADELLRWNKAAGKVMKGLTTRREKERSLFLS